MKRKKMGFMRFCMQAQPGEGIDAGSAASPNVKEGGAQNTAATPKDTVSTTAQAAPAANTASPAEPAKNTDPGTAEKKETNPGGQKEQNTLLGGAGKERKENPASGNAEPKPNGGEPGDGKAQDPYGELKFPEGAVVDETQKANYKKLAGELGLSLDGAQRLMDFEAQRLLAQSREVAEVWKQQAQEKYGAELPGVLANAARALDALGGAELRSLLDQTGLGNHPIMLEAFSKAGAMLKEDKSVPSSGGAGGDVTFEQALYGNPRSK